MAGRRMAGRSADVTHLETDERINAMIQQSQPYHYRGVRSIADLARIVSSRQDERQSVWGKTRILAGDDFTIGCYSCCCRR